MPGIYDKNNHEIRVTGNLEGLIADRLLIWHDEFDTKNIDEKKWSNQYGRYWTGMNWNSPDIMRNMVTGNGASYFTTKDNPKDNVNFSSILIHTAGKFEFKYGRLEAKMRFPNKSPHHSTFWTLGTAYQLRSIGEDSTMGYGGLTPPSAGEIDIAEFNNGTVGFRAHYSNAFDNNVFVTMGNISDLTPTPTDWHVYAIEWDENSIKSYVDDVLKSTVPIESTEYSNGFNPFKAPHYIILNCIPKLPTDEGNITWDVAQTDVKWVRVYAPVGVSEYVVETALTLPETLNIGINEKKYLFPVFTPANPSDATIRWYSYDESVATCYGGIVQGKKAGTVLIKGYTNHGCVAFCKVTVA